MKHKKKQKINVYLSPQELKDLTRKCNEIGVTRSTFGRMVIKKSLYFKKENKK